MLLDVIPYSPPLPKSLRECDKRGTNQHLVTKSHAANTTWYASLSADAEHVQEQMENISTISCKKYDDDNNKGSSRTDMHFGSIKT